MNVGSRSKQGSRCDFPVGCFVTCDVCQVVQRGSFDELAKFIQEHDKAHELKVWIPAERMS